MAEEKIIGRVMSTVVRPSMLDQIINVQTYEDGKPKEAKTCWLQDGGSITWDGRVICIFEIPYRLMRSPFGAKVTLVYRLGKDGPSSEAHFTSYKSETDA